VPRKKSATLTDHELRLMNVLWREGPSTVSDVVAGLEPPPLAYSTVLTTLRTLEQKGFIEHEEDGRAYVYRALIERRDAARSAIDQLLGRFFGNSPGALAVTLLDETPLNKDELAKIEQLLSKRKRGSR
jgi:predicted transcriptional regulator